MRKSIVALLSLCVLFVGTAVAADLPGQGDDAGKTVIYRDTWGVPHIYAPTAEQGMYAMGWAQAEDRPEELLKNLLRGAGEIASVDGEAAIGTDKIVAMWDLYNDCKRNIDKVAPEVRKLTQAYVSGVNDYYKQNPSAKPAWWGDRQADEAMVMSFGRIFLQNWSFDDGFDDLKRGGIEPGTFRMSRGSNQWAIAPERSASKVPMLYIDPHLGWTGITRFWEFRIHAGNLHGSGFSLPGQLFVGLGHNENVAWAMTTGGPDTADVYELTLKEDDSTKYLYDGEWRSLKVRKVMLGVKDGNPVEYTVYESHHGPIGAIENGKAYAVKSAYFDSVEGSEAWYEFNRAKNYKGIKKGLAGTHMFPQNVMVADTSGNIYYQRTGRVPIRAAGYEWSKPVDGSTSKSEWLGIHPAKDHLQVLNPPQGYMQNCNIPPDSMMVNSPFKVDPARPYLFADLSHNPSRDGWSNTRGARAVELLHNDSEVTVEEVLAYAVDAKLYGADRWLEALKQADQALGGEVRKDPAMSAALDELLAWDSELLPESKGALKYYYWRRQAEKDANDIYNALRKRINNFRAPLGVPSSPVALDENEKKALITAFANGMADLKSDFGSLDKVYGDVFRVGRGEKSFPCGGGGDGGLDMTTLRNVSYSQEREDHTRWGRGGQTSTQIVVMSKPVKSWTYVPLGQSDDPASPHYMDQAEKLFSKGRLKESWWTPEELAKNVAKRTVIAE
ncbi:MAG TPA: penicillin acylase family protein [Candidatus Hydrogenedentes bacterium]|nr:penicillin acylase family protein [Candidatus Hydrogenedentota bacterium]HRK34514.1 penicillin acylase family protein [Candidatus Hydrogenedentota bacterium]